MTFESLSVRRTARRLAPALAMLAAAAAPAAPAAAEPWQIEPIGASEGVRELHELSFDGEGRALLSWDADLLGHAPQVFGGLATRDPAGGWQRPPNLAGVDPATAQVHVLSEGRTLLVAREGGPAGPGRRRLVVAAGGSDGGFGPLVTLAAVHRAVVVGGERLRATRSSHGRTSARRFSPSASASAAGTSARAATLRSHARRPSRSTRRGDRLLAWPDGRRIAVRVRRAGGSWGPRGALRAPARRPRPPAVGADHAVGPHDRHLGTRPRRLRRRRARPARLVARADGSRRAAGPPPSGRAAHR